VPLLLTDDQVLLADSARPFLTQKGGVRCLRALRDASDATGFSRELWAEFGAMGFTGALIPESEGGSGLGHVEVGIILEEIGRSLTPSPFLSTAVGAATALAAASSEQRGRFLPGVVAGTTIAALAIDEGARHRPERIALKAERAGNGFRLTGEKTFVAHGHVADVIVVAARTSGRPDDAEGVTLFLVERGAKGLGATPARLADANLAARVRFEGVELDADAVIGDVDGGGTPLARLLGAVRAGAAAELLGVGAGAMALTVDYLKTRKQFGQLIGAFQALQHRAAHLYSEMEVARSANLKAQQRLDAADPEAARAVHVAKAMAGLAAALAVQEGVQMHGGVGMTDAFDIGLYMKRARVLAETFGDADYHADALARLDGY
jgi:alkylation response protein AidB-like acyl-CoA dehydrogenase